MLFKGRRGQGLVWYEIEKKRAVGFVIELRMGKLVRSNFMFE